MAVGGSGAPNLVPRGWQSMAGQPGRVKDAQGFWGRPTATIDWCEANYVVSYYVAEWWNTLSNVALLVLGVYGVRMCLREGMRDNVDLLLLFGLIAVVGIGSAAFHGTLLKTSQQLDETPMGKECLPFSCLSIVLSSES